MGQAQPVDDLGNTAESISIHFLNEIISNEELLDKLLDYDNNKELFGTGYSKDNYLSQIGEYLKRQLQYNQSKEQQGKINALVERYIKKVVTSFPEYELPFIIARLPEEVLNQNSELGAKLFKIDFNIKAFGALTVDNIKMKVADKIFQCALRLNDQDKKELLSSELLNRYDFNILIKVINSIEDNKMKFELLDSMPRLMREFTEEQYAMVFDGMKPPIDVREIDRYIMKLNYPNIQVRDKQILLGCLMGLKPDEEREKVFYKVQAVDPSLINKEVIANFVMYANDTKVVKRFLLSEGVREKLNIFDYSFMMQKFVYGQGVQKITESYKKEVLFDPLLANKFSEYGINEINKNQSIADIFNRFNITYYNLVTNGINQGQIDIELLKTVVIDNGPVSKKPLNQDNVLKALTIMLNEENRYCEYDSKVAKYMMTLLAQKVLKEKGVAYKVTFESLPAVVGKIKYGDCDINSKSIRVNSDYVSAVMIKNLEMFNTIYHEAEHAKQFDDLNRGVISFGTLRMAKEQFLGRFLDEADDNYNYKYCSFESDARCKAVVNTIKLLKKIAPDLAEQRIDEYIENIEKEVGIRNDNGRKLETGQLYDLDTIYDQQFKPEEIVRHMEKYPVLLFEYNEQGKKRSVVELLEARQSYFEQIEDLGMSKQQLKENEGSLLIYSTLKKKYGMYDKLINHNKKIAVSSIENDIIVPRFDIEGKFEEWTELSTYKPDNPQLIEARDEYLTSSMINYFNHQELVKEFSPVAKEKEQEIAEVLYYNMVATLGVGETNVPNAREKYEMFDVLELIADTKNNNSMNRENEIVEGGMSRGR